MPLSVFPQAVESCAFVTAVAERLAAFFRVFAAFRTNLLAFLGLPAAAPRSIKVRAWFIRPWTGWRIVSPSHSTDAVASLKMQRTPSKPPSGQGMVVVVVDDENSVVVVLLELPVG
jgi:hypothetical protein